MDKRRSGTIHEGDDYEYLVAALLSLGLILNDDVTNFTLRTNLDKFGAFDDLIINIETNDDEYNFAIQLKHKSNAEKKLNIATFAPKKDENSKVKGDFNLGKYYQGYKKLETKIQNNYKFIIFTNIGFDKQRTANSQSNEINLLPNRICPGLDLINTGTSDKFFQFEAKSDQGYNEFLSKCFLLTQQITVSAIQQTLRKLCEKSLKMDEALCSTFATQYINYFKQWHQNRFYNSKLEKELVLLKIVDLLLTPHIMLPEFCSNDDVNCNHYYKLIEDAICNFQLTIVDINLGQTKLIWKTITELNNEDIISRAKILNLFEDKQTVSDLTDLIKMKVLSFDSQLRRPIFVKVTQENQQSLETVLKFIEKRPISLVFLGKFRNFDKTEIEIFHHMKALADINQNVYSKIITTCYLSLQGRESIRLEEVLGNDTDLQNLITINEVINAEIFGKRLIGEEQEQLPSSYVPRHLPVRIFDRLIIKDINDLILIDCNVFYKSIKDYIKNNLRRKFQTITDFMKNPENDVQILLTNQFSYEEFGRLPKKPKENIHSFVVINDNQLQWLQTRGNLNQLKNKEHKMNLINEAEIFEKFQNTTNVICAVPGMGKSTLLKNIKNNCPSHYWAIKIDYNSIEQLLQNSSINLQQLIENCFEICTKNYSKVAKMICNNYLKRKKVIFFWDALDELRSESLVENALNCAVALQKQGYKQWIFSRVNQLDLIEDQLQLFTINISEFTPEEQQSYIENRLKAIKTKEEIDEIIAQLYQTVKKISSSHTLGIPLQLHMITEIILQSPDKSLADFKELHIVTKLYKYFFKAKCNLYYKQLDRAVLKIIFNDSFNKYQIAAMLTYFKAKHLALALHENILDELNKDFNKILKEFKKKGKTEGVIVNVNVEKRFVIFEHNTYGEYCAAAWLAKNVEKRYMAKFSKFMFEQEYRNIRYLFDMILAESAPILLKILQGEEMDEIPDGVMDLAGRTSAHVICSWGVQHNLSTSSTFIEDRKLINSVTVISLDKNKICQNIRMGNQASNLKYKKDKLFQWTPLQYAEASKSLAIIEGLQITSEDFEKITLFKYCRPQIAWYSLKYNYRNILIKLNQQLRTLYFRVMFGFAYFTSLMIAIQYNQFDVIKYLVEQVGVDINEEISRYTALSIAVTTNRPKIAKYLIEQGGDINWSNCENNTTLLMEIIIHITDYVDFLPKILKKFTNLNQINSAGYSALAIVISSKRNTELVKLLLTIKNIDVHWRHPSDGRTLLMCAVRAGDFEVVKLLIEKFKLSVHDVDNDECPVIYYWTQREQSKDSKEILQYLIAKGADCKWRQPVHGATLVMYAVRDSNFQIIQILIEHLKLSVNDVNNNGYSVIYYLTEREQSKDSKEILQYLIANGANYKWRHPLSGTTLLMYATRNSNFEIIQILIEHLKLSANDVNNNGYSVIYYLTEREQSKDSKEILQYLTAKGADYKWRHSVYGTTLLMYAVRDGNFEIVKSLIENFGLSVNDVNNNGYSVIYYLAERTQLKDSKEILQYLTAKGADCKWRHPVYGTTLLMFAVRDGNFEIVKSLIEHFGLSVSDADNNGYSVIQYLTERKQSEDSKEILQYLITKGADCKWRHPVYGTTLLMHAVQYGNFEIVKSLIENFGLSVNDADNNGYSVIQYLTERKQSEDSKVILQYLRDKGADYKWRHPVYGATLLMFAVRDGNFEIVKSLIEHFGLSVSDADNNGYSVIQYLTERKQSEDSKEILQYLITKGADCKWRHPVYGTTLLMHAVQYGNFEIVKSLIENFGLSVNDADNNGYSVIQYLTERKQSEDSKVILQYLRDKGADYKWRHPVYGATLLMYAVKNSNFEMVKILIEDCRVDVNESDNKQLTASNYAILPNSSTRIVEYLKEKGARRIV